MSPLYSVVEIRPVYSYSVHIDASVTKTKDREMAPRKRS